MTRCARMEAGCSRTAEEHGEDLSLSFQSVGPVLGRIDAYLEQAGVDPAHPRLEDLFPFDQLHLYGILGTRDHLDRIQIRRHFHVLDIGAGLGGVARLLAHDTGCCVTGLDLSPSLVRAAMELTARVGLSRRIRYVVGDALRLPFDDASFDHALCHYVTMNIADKRGLLREVARVLKPGGVLSVMEATCGPNAPPRYPLPWASHPEESYLAPAQAIQGAVREAGLRPLVIEEHLAPPSGVMDRLRLDVLLPNWPERERNIIDGRRNGSISDQFVLAEKP